MLHVQPQDPYVAPGAALLFPGQGSQVPGMRDLVAAHCPELLEQAHQAVGPDLFDRVEASTAYAQPAIYCASIAGWHRMGRARAPYMAGHSLGEVAALVAAGSLGEADGLRLVVLRGRLMAAAAERRPGGMLAALRAPDQLVADVVAETGIAVANDNAPGQLVLSGDVPAVDAAQRMLKAAGARAVRLPVAAAFHSPAMAPAVEAFAAELERCTFAPPESTVISCATAQPFTDPARELAESLVAPVRWRDVLHMLDAAGVARYVDVGPGQVLAGLVRRTLPAANAEPDRVELAPAA
jgi:[acyl-carrier-protein] S-malonyltransferase